MTRIEELYAKLGGPEQVAQLQHERLVGFMVRDTAGMIELLVPVPTPRAAFFLRKAGILSRTDPSPRLTSTPYI